jgi:hypothetical protein
MKLSIAGIRNECQQCFFNHLIFRAKSLPGVIDVTRKYLGSKVRS